VFVEGGGAPVPRHNGTMASPSLDGRTELVKQHRARVHSKLTCDNKFGFVID